MIDETKKTPPDETSQVPPVSSPWDNQMREIIGPSWDNFDSTSQNDISRTILRLSGDHQMSQDLIGRPMITPNVIADTSRPDSMTKAYAGLGLSSNLTAKWIYNGFRKFDQNIDGTMIRVVPGTPESPVHFETFTVDTFFGDLLGSGKPLTDSERDLAEKWMLGDLDHITDPGRLAIELGYYKAERDLKIEASKLDALSGFVLGTGATFGDPISIVAGGVGGRVVATKAIVASMGEKAAAKFLTTAKGQAFMAAAEKGGLAPKAMVASIGEEAAAKFIQNARRFAARESMVAKMGKEAADKFLATTKGQAVLAGTEGAGFSVINELGLQAGGEDRTMEQAISNIALNSIMGATIAGVWRGFIKNKGTITPADIQARAGQAAKVANLVDNDIAPDNFTSVLDEIAATAAEKKVSLVDDITNHDNLFVIRDDTNFEQSGYIFFNKGTNDPEIFMTDYEYAAWAELNPEAAAAVEKLPADVEAQVFKTTQDEWAAMPDPQGLIGPDSPQVLRDWAERWTMDQKGITTDPTKGKRLPGRAIAHITDEDLINWSGVLQEDATRTLSPEDIEFERNRRELMFMIAEGRSELENPTGATIIPELDDAVRLAGFDDLSVGATEETAQFWKQELLTRMRKAWKAWKSGSPKSTEVITRMFISQTDLGHNPTLTRLLIDAWNEHWKLELSTQKIGKSIDKMLEDFANAEKSQQLWAEYDPQSTFDPNKVTNIITDYSNFEAIQKPPMPPEVDIAKLKTEQPPLAGAEPGSGTSNISEFLAQWDARLQNMEPKTQPKQTAKPVVIGAKDMPQGFVPALRPDGTMHWIDRMLYGRTKDGRKRFIDGAIFPNRSAPITTGLRDSIKPDLRFDDFKQLKPSNIDPGKVKFQAGMLSNYGFEKSKNAIVQILATRTFDRIGEIVGWKTGRVKGFSSYEQRMGFIRANEMSADAGLNKYILDNMKRMVSPSEKAKLVAEVGDAWWSPKMRELRTLIDEKIEIERNLAIVEHDLGIDPVYYKTRLTEIVKELRTLGAPDDLLEVSIHKLDELYFNSRDKLGDSIDGQRLEMYDTVTRVILDPETLEPIQFIDMLKLIEDRKNFADAVDVPGFVSSITDKEILAKAINEGFITHNDLNAIQLVRDGKPVDYTSITLLNNHLATYWNESVHSWVNIHDGSAFLSTVRGSRVSAKNSLRAFYRDMSNLESYALYSHVFKETYIASENTTGMVKLSDMPGVQPVIGDDGLVVPGKEGLYNRILAFADNMDDLNFDESIASMPRNMLKEILDTLKNFATKYAKDMEKSIGNTQSDVDGLFEWIGRENNFIDSYQSPATTAATHIAKNYTSAVTLGAASFAQIPDTATLMTVTKLNGVEGAMSKIGMAMARKWNEIGLALPQARAAFFRGLGIRAENSLSFMQQRFSNEAFHVGLNPNEQFALNHPNVAKTEATAKMAAAFTSRYSGTEWMNLTNKAGAYGATIHELTDATHGIIPRLYKAVQKMNAAKGTDILPYIEAEGLTPELSSYVLRSLREDDLKVITKMIDDGYFEDVILKKRWSFIFAKSSDTIKVIGNPRNAAEAISVEKLSALTNMIVGRKVAIPGMIESNNMLAGFGNEMIAQFVRAPLAVGTRMFIGSTFAPLRNRIMVATAMLGAATIAGIARAYLDGKGDEYVQNMVDNPVSVIVDRLAYTGFAGVLGEKMIQIGLDSFDPKRQGNLGDFQTKFPVQGVAQNLIRTGAGAKNLLTGNKMTPSQANALWKSLVLGEAAASRAILRAFDVIRGDGNDGKAYINQAIGLVKEPKEKSK